MYSKRPTYSQRDLHISTEPIQMNCDIYMSKETHLYPPRSFARSLFQSVVSSRLKERAFSLSSPLAERESVFQSVVSSLSVCRHTVSSHSLSSPLAFSYFLARSLCLACSLSLCVFGVCLVSLLGRARSLSLFYVHQRRLWIAGWSVIWIESDNTHVCRSLKEIRKKLEQNARLKSIMDNPSAPESERIQVLHTHSHTHGHTYIHFACVYFSYVCMHSCIHVCFHLYLMCARTYTCTYVCMHLCRCVGDESRRYVCKNGRSYAPG